MKLFSSVSKYQVRPEDGSGPRGENVSIKHWKTALSLLKRCVTSYVQVGVNMRRNATEL